MRKPFTKEKETLMLMTLLLVILILAFFGGLPAWPYSREWGYGPSGVSGLLLIIVIILLLTRAGVP